MGQLREGLAVGPVPALLRQQRDPDRRRSWCCQLFFACTAAYAFAKLRFPGRDLCFVIVMACLIVPPQVRFVPLYILFSHLGS